MSNWVLLHEGESVPQMEPNSMVHLALQKGAIIRVMFRFVKNIKNPIAGYLIESHDAEWTHAGFCVGSKE